MKYICIDPKTFELTFSDTKTGECIFILPINRSSLRRTEFHDFVYFDVIYPVVESEQKQKSSSVLGATSVGGKIKYSLVTPNPWLVAIACIMWEGVVQGLTWDIVKTSVLSALDRLKSKGLAPTEIGTEKEIIEKLGKTKAKAQLGFSWRSYSADGKPLHDFFLGLQSSYEKKSEKQRSIIRKSILK